VRNPLPLFLLAALAATFINPAEAFATLDHPGHNPSAKCSWQADILPVFPPEETAVNSIGWTARYTLLGNIAGVVDWSVQVMPGYHVGYVHAMDQAAPGKSIINKAFARRSVYGVYRSVDCCWPARRAKALMSCGFRVGAGVPNPPGQASAQGVTTIFAVNTVVTLVTASSVTTDAEEGGTEISLELPGPKGAKAKVKFTIKFGSADESIDEVSTTTAGISKPAPDEEYHITTDLDLKASADGYAFNTGESEAYLNSHRISITTKVSCGHCSASLNKSVVVNGASYGSTN